MKKIIYLLLFVLTTSCGGKVEDNYRNRIKVNNSRVVSGYRVTIIEIDGKEYLTTNKGGFLELKK